jgi:hypothetical protein
MASFILKMEYKFMESTSRFAGFVICCFFSATIATAWAGTTYSINVTGTSSRGATAPANGFVARELAAFDVHFSIKQLVSEVIGAPVDAYVCVIDNTSHCVMGESPTVFPSVQPNTAYSGQVTALAPRAMASAPVTVALCQGPVPSGAGPILCNTLATAKTSTPVYAEYMISVSSFTISHTRAVHHDTVIINSIAGILGQNGPACSQTSPPSGVQTVQQGNLNNGTYVAKGSTFGPFQIVPSNTALYLGYAILNFGAGYSTTSYNALTGNATRLLGCLATVNFPQGDSALSPVPSYQQQINKLSWHGCDGPLAVDVVGLYDGVSDNPPSGNLHTLTDANGQFSKQAGPYEFESQTGCGESPKYTVNWKIVRTSLP